MATQDPRVTEKLERTSVLVPADTMAALRALAEKGDRPLSREIRRALEDHIDRESGKAAA